MHFGDERRHYVAVFRMVVVVLTVEVAGGDTEEAGTMLVMVGAAHLDTCQVGHGVGGIGRLQVTAPQMPLIHRLRALARINAGVGHEEQLLHPILPGRLDEVGLDLQIRGDEVGAVGLVGHQSAYLGGGDEDVA